MLNAGKTDEALNFFLSQSQDAIKSSHMESVNIFQDTTRYDRYIEKGEDFEKFYVTTGFEELDELIGGWDRQEEVATIVARTGVGKTWCLLKTAIAAASAGLDVGIFSGEMSADSVGYRIDTLISHISNGSIVHGNMSVKDEYSHFMRNLPTMFKGSIRVLTPDMIDGKAGVTALRGFIKKYNLEMLCIDQHSLLEDDRNARNPVDAASNISKDLKKLQVTEKIPIIAVSQQNRTQLDSGKVDSMQIAAADRIGQDSSVILFITSENDVMTLHLVKARNSLSGKRLSYSCDINRGVFQYIPEETNALDGAGSEELRKEFEYYENDEEGEVF